MRLTYFKKKKTLCLFKTVLLSLIALNLNAATPHIVGGTVTYSGGGSPSPVTFSAYITSRSGDILTQSSVGCGYSGGSYWVQVGNFDNAWTAGDVFHIDLSDGNGGFVSGEITLTDNSGDQLDLTISLPDISVDPDNINYGSVTVGDSYIKYLEVVNAGGSVLNISSTSITGTDADEYDITSGAGSFDLSEGASHTIGVQLHPSSAGSKDAALCIESNDPDDNLLYIPLSGSGVVPSISASPDAVNFGSVNVRDHADETIVISNSGSGDLNISSVSFIGSGSAHFAIQSGGGTTDISPGSTHDIVVRFNPEYIGSVSADLQIESNDPDDNPYFISLTGTGLAPVIYASPNPADFGNLDLNAYSEITITLTNNGNTSLDITNTYLTGTDAGQFSIESGGGSATVIPGDSHNIIVRCSPVSAGEINAVLSIESNDPNENQYIITLRCTGIAPDIHVSPSSADYGDVLTGKNSTKSFSISNTGNSLLNVTSATITGANAGDFEITGGEGSFSLGISETNIIDVEFDPIAPGARHAFLHIESNDPDEDILDVALAGTGVEPDISALPELVEYGNVNVGSYSDMTIQISNNGSSELVITSTSITGTGASYFAVQSGGGSAIINPGSTHDIIVRLSPVSEGAVAANLNIASNDPDENPFVIPLTGNCVGIPELSVSPVSKNFGSVLIGSGLSQTFTISNTGTGALTVSSTALSGTGAGNFSIVNGGAEFTVSPGDSHYTEIRFVPGSVGLSGASFIITSNDPVNTPLQVALTGKGVSTPVPSISIEPSSVDYGLVPLDSAAEKTFEIANHGTADLIITDIITGGAGGNSFEIKELLFPLYLQPESSFEFKVIFNADSEQETNAELKIVNNDLDNDTLKVPLKGTGYQPNLNPPNLVYCYPGNNSKEVTRNAGIQIKISDDEDGVDLATLDIRINDILIISGGKDQTGDNVEIKNDLNRCSVLYTPANCFDQDQTVFINIKCRDRSLYKNELDTTLSFATGKYVSGMSTNCVLGPEGGTLTDSLDKIEINIPRNALEDSVHIFIGIIDSLTDLPSMPDTVKGMGPAYYFGTDGIRFNKPVIIGIPYTLNDLELAEVTSPDDLPVYCFSVLTDRWKYCRVIDYDDNYFYVVVDELGTLIKGKSTITAINDFRAVINKSVLYQNYPNPVNDITTISFFISGSGNVSLRIYDINFRLMKVLINNYFISGKYDIMFDTTACPGGIYFYRLQTDTDTITKKMIIN